MRVLKADSGQAMVEYVLILCLVAMVCLGGALLLGKALSDKIGKPLKAATVAHGQETLGEARLTVEQGLRLLGSPDRQDIFSILQGPTTSSLLKHAEAENALLIVGAYGFRSPEDNVLGSTTTGIIRSAKCSVLIFR